MGVPQRIRKLILAAGKDLPLDGLAGEKELEPLSKAGLTFAVWAPEDGGRSIDLGDLTLRPIGAKPLNLNP
jgi:hypothetical protein